MRRLSQSPFHSLRFDVLKEGSNIVRPLQTVINHKGVFENIQDQEGSAARRMADVMFIDSLVDQLSKQDSIGKARENLTNQ